MTISSSQSNRAVEPNQSNMDDAQVSFDKSGSSAVVAELENGSFNDAKIEYKKADNTLKFLESYDSEFANVEFTEEEDRQLSKKVNYYLLPLLWAVNTMLFIDKSTLSYSSILGLFDSTKINTGQFDDLNSIFYAGYIVGQVLNFGLQKYNLGKFLTAIIFIWSVLIYAHCGASNFGGLVVLRLLLGFTESIVVPALEITLLQFYTPTQRATIQPIFWISCVGSPVIIAGFMAYGVLHATDAAIPPWKIFMLINGSLTLILAAVVAIFYPGDPSEARFLTPKEKYFLIRKVQRTSKAAITQHSIKKYQVVEALRDPITWLFGAYTFFLMLANNLNMQQNLLAVSLGATQLGSTLIAVASGGFSTAYAIFGSSLIHHFPNNSFWMILVGCIPSVAGGIAMVTIPWDNKLALLAMLVLAANTYFLSYILGLGWSTASCAGNTKRYVRHLVVFFFYGVANVVAPQLWKGNQAPRYYIAWSVQIVLAWVLAPAIAGVITLVLKQRNRERLQYIEEHRNALVGTVVKVDEQTGQTVDEQVDIANLDLTDLENKAFIYPL